MQRNVLDYLEDSIRRYPNKIAFVDDNDKYSFRRFGYMAKKVASGITKRVFSINKPVIVLVDRNVESLVSLMAVLYSGNFYVPVDSKMPKKRLEAIISQVDPCLIIDCAKNISNDNAVSFDELKTTEINEDILAQNRGKVLDIDPAYVIFTSGSTGNPKGIVISHRSVIDFIEWMAEACNISSKCVFGSQAPFYFDLSVKDIYLTLKCGATMHVLSRKDLMFPMNLVNSLNNKKVNTLIWATSAFNLVASSGVLLKNKPKYLKKVVLGGEALLAKNLNIWRRVLPKVQYINLYGPTEVTVDCTYYLVDKEFSDNEEIPIGKACENKEVILLNEELKEVQVGEIGEICVRGIGLAKGYYNDSEKTENVFIQNPNNPYYRDIIYKTGDLGVKNEEGEIFFKARKDGQIKHMGYRIELGEIEVAVNSVKEIKAAICFYDEEDNKIVCVYEGELSESDLVKNISDIIPKYMIPNVYKRVDNLLYNANGKIDRVCLKENYFNEKSK
ncbi:MAG: amino acid adenylation domain-containing protein [Clostridiales bacterium]|nr:amino acid adenylation domain-containing protein [Clostridiales bacterium]